eukprot:9499027-Heterocapsa_arctica.AAC.1
MCPSSCPRSTPRDAGRAEEEWARGSPVRLQLFEEEGGGDACPDSHWRYEASGLRLRGRREAQRSQ